MPIPSRPSRQKGGSRSMKVIIALALVLASEKGGRRRANAGPTLKARSIYRRQDPGSFNLKGQRSLFRQGKRALQANRSLRGKSCRLRHRKSQCSKVLSQVSAWFAMSSRSLNRGFQPSVSPINPTPATKLGGSPALRGPKTTLKSVPDARFMASTTSSTEYPRP